MLVHLIDGTYELFRAFYGPPSRRAPDGMEVGATYGLMLSLASLLRSDGVTHIAVAFDHVIESFRNDLFAGYKTGTGIDPELYAQFGLAEEATAALGITVWSMVEFEADDALATAAHRFAIDNEVEQVQLCSPDKDLMQCVRGERIVLFDRKARLRLDEEAVRAKMGVDPASIPDFLALVGDSADGIPGIPRWGKKSAGAILARHGHLESIPRDPEAWDVPLRGKLALAESLFARFDDALLYRTLATLRPDVPLVEDLAQLRWTGPDHDRLAALVARLGVRPIELPSPC